MLSFLHVLPPLLLRPVLLGVPRPVLLGVPRPVLLGVPRPLLLCLPPLLLGLSSPPQDAGGEQVAQRFPTIGDGK